MKIREVFFYCGEMVSHGKERDTGSVAENKRGVNPSEVLREQFGMVHDEMGLGLNEVLFQFLCVEDLEAQILEHLILISV